MSSKIILKSLKGSGIISNVELSEEIKLDTDLQLTENNAFEIGSNDKKLKTIYTTNLETENITTNNLIVNTTLQSLYQNTIGSILTFSGGSISINTTENISNLGMTVYKNRWEDIRVRVYEIVGNYTNEKQQEIVDEIESQFANEENDLNLISFTEILSMLENLPENIEDFFNDIYDILFVKHPITSGMIINCPLKITENTFVEETALKPYIRSLFSAKIMDYNNIPNQPFNYDSDNGRFELEIDYETIKITGGKLYAVQTEFNENTFNTIGNKINITLNTIGTLITTASGLSTDIQLEFPLQYNPETPNKIELKYNPYDFQVSNSTISSNYLNINLNTLGTLITTSSGIATNILLDNPLDYDSTIKNKIKLKYNTSEFNIDSMGNLNSNLEFASPLNKTLGNISLTYNNMFENSIDNKLNLKIDDITIKQKTSGTLYVNISSQNPLLTYSTTGRLNLSITKGNAIFLSTSGNINLSHANSLSISNNKLFTNISSQTPLISYNNSTGILTSNITAGNYISISSGVISSTITSGNAIDISPITSVINVKYDNRTIKLDQDGNLETRFTTGFPLEFNRTTGLLHLNLNENTLTVFNDNLQTNLDGDGCINVNNSNGTVSISNGNSLQVSGGNLITNISSNTSLLSYNNLTGVLSSNITTGIALEQHATLPKFDVKVDNKTIKVNSSNQLETNFTTSYPLTFNRTTGTLDLNINNNTLTTYNNQLQTNLNAVGPINFSNSSGTMSLSTGSSLVVYGNKLFTRMTTSSPMLSVNNSTGNISLNIAGSAPITISGTTVSLSIDNSTLTVSTNMLKANYQAGSGITITGNSIALSTDAQDQIDEAQSSAETAQSTANGAQTLASSANAEAVSATGLASGAVAGVTALEAQLAGATALMTSSIAGLGASIAWSAFGGSLLGGLVGMLFGKRETVSSGTTLTTQGNVVFRDELSGQITSANVLFTLGNILTMNSNNISTATLNIVKGTLGSLFINTSGNVGINNTAPTYRLSISDNSVSIGHQIRVENTNTGNRAGILLKNGTKNGFSLQHDSNGHAYVETLDTSGNMLFYSSGIFGFYDKSMANIERMRIQNSSGNVGIGITNPAHQLDVANGIQSLYNTTSNLKCTNATITNAIISGATIASLYGSLVNVVSTNQSTSNITTGTLTVTTGLTSPLSTITTSTLSNIVNTNISSSNITVSNLRNNSATIANEIVSNSTITNLVNNYITTGTIITTNVSSSNLYSLNNINIISTIANANIYQATVGNIYVGTSGKIGINNTDPSYTFDVSGIMKSTGLITYDSVLINQSSSTLVNSGLIQTASLYSTNISSSNISTSNLTSNTISSSVLNLNVPSIGANTVLNLNNGNLIGANSLRINDPGTNNEGIFFDGGNLWQIAEAPNALGNGTGNLQVILNGSRSATFESSGNFYVKTNISSAGLITTNITASSIVSSNGNLINITNSNLRTSNISTSNIISTNVNTTSLSASSINVSETNIQNITGTTTNSYILNSTIANFVSSTIGDLLNTNLTTSNIVNENLITTNISCANLDTFTLDASFATTGILKSTIIDTNVLVSVDITSGSIVSSNISTSNILTNTINASNGSLTNISNSNLINTNISTSSLTSNTINSSILNLNVPSIGAGDVLNLNNGNLIGANSVHINDPGTNGEGIYFDNGNGWQLAEATNTLSNASGNLQVILNGSRSATFESSGNFYVKTNISSSGLITSNITTTNLIATNATIANFKNLFDNAIYNSQANLNITNSTINNLVNSSISSGNIKAVYSNITNASIGNFKALYDASIYNSQESMMITNNTSFNLVSSNITSGAIVSSYGDFSNMSIGNFKALYDASIYNSQETLVLTNSSISSLHVDNLDIGNLANVSVIVNSNLSGTIANYAITNNTSTNLRNSYSTISNTIITNATIANLKTTFPTTYSSLLISGATIGNIASLVNSVTSTSNYLITNNTTINLRASSATITNLVTTFPTTYANLNITNATIANFKTLYDAQIYSSQANLLLTNATITSLTTTFPTTYSNLNITNATIANFKTLYDAQIYSSQANLLLTNATITSLTTTFPTTYSNLNITNATIANFKTLYDAQIYSSQANLLLTNATITSLTTTFPTTYSNLNITNATLGNISTLVNNNLRSTISNYLITNNTSTNLRASSATITNLVTTFPTTYSNLNITNATIANFKTLYDAQIYSSQATLSITNSTINSLRSTNIYADSITIGNITNIVNNSLYSSISSYLISNATITSMIGDTLNMNTASISNLITNYPTTYSNLNITNATIANFKTLFDNQIYNSQANLNITNATIANISTLVNNNLRSTISNYLITNNTSTNIVATNATITNLITNYPTTYSNLSITNATINNFKTLFDNQIYNSQANLNITNATINNISTLVNNNLRSTISNYLITNNTSTNIVATNATITNLITNYPTTYSNLNITNATIANFKTLYDNQIYNSQANLLITTSTIPTLISSTISSSVLSLNNPSLGAVDVLNLNNGNLIGANSVHINDPGTSGEGLFFDGGNLWQIAEAPNALGNGSGHLQIIINGTRNATFETSGNLYVKTNISSAGLITTNISASNINVSNITIGNINSLVNNNINTSISNYLITNLTTSNAVITNGLISNASIANISALVNNNLNSSISNYIINYSTIGNLVAGSTKIYLNYPLEFGFGYGKEVNAGKCGYNLFSSDAVDIVGGMQNNITTGTRKVKIWDELITDSIKTQNVYIGTSSTMNSFGYPMYIGNYQDDIANVNNSGAFVTAGTLTSASGYKISWQPSGSFSVMSSSYTFSSRLSLVCAFGILCAQIQVISDERGKEYITDFPKKSANDIITSTRIVSYIDKETKKARNGVIAQEFEKIIPEAITKSPRIIKGKLIEDYHSVDYQYLYNSSIVVIQDLLRRVEKLESYIKKK